MAARIWFAACAIGLLAGVLRAETNIVADSKPATGVHPRYFRSEDSWMDRSHAWAGSNMHSGVIWFDSLFLKEPGTRPMKDTRTRFRLGLYAITDPRYMEETVRLDANMSGRVDLPRLRERMRLVIDTRDIEALPGAYPDERKDKINLAFRRVGKVIDTDVGVKIKSSPVAFIKSSTGIEWKLGDWQWLLGQKVFFQNDTRFGEVSTLTQHRWIGPNLMLGHTSAGRWTEVSDGLEWEDAIGLSHVRLLMDEEDRGSFAGVKDIAWGNGLRLSVNGYHDGSMVTERYRAAAFWRRPLGEKDWCFLEVAPEVEWTKEEDWEADYVLRVGFDILFQHER
jgi:hypothetical protein